MHTETNRKLADDAAAWLWKEWSNVLKLKQDGVPILGFTWYSLLDQTDWNTALREVNNRVNPMGLYDLKRNIREVGKAYKELIAQWRDPLPLQSMSRDMLLYPHERQPQQRLPAKRTSQRHVRSRQSLEIGSRANAQQEAKGRPEGNSPPQDRG